MVNNKTVGEAIRQYRVIKHLSQTSFGDIVNLPKQTISKIEKGKRPLKVTELVEIVSKTNDIFLFKFVLTGGL